MKRYFAVTLSVLLWMVSALSVSADWNYNDDQLNWGSDTCAHLDVTVVAAVASTCTQAGHAAYTQCNDCGAIIYGSDAALPLLSHSYDAVVTAPDCEKGGYTTYTCANCGDSYVADKVDALGHTPGLPAYCDRDQTCTVCDAVLVPALGHNYISETFAPGCEDDGYTEHICDRCGDGYVDGFITATGHTPGDPPDCGHDQTCIVCGKVLTEATGHDWVDASCTAPKTCAACGTTEGDVLDHVYDDDFDADCNVCGDLRDASIPGDVNGDGRVNNRDLGILQRYLNEWDIAIDKTATDLNGDGKVNNRDLGMIQQLLNE